MATTTLTEAATVPTADFHIVKTELHDAEVMDALWNDRSGTFASTVISRLRLYCRARKHGNQKEVVYHYGKDWADYELGRLYAKDGQGLQSYQADIRNPLLAKHYWDLDMENAHYVILAKLADGWGLKTDAIRQYISNRDAELRKVSSERIVAKTAFLKVAYGGDIKLASEGYRDYDVPADGDGTLLKAIEAEMRAIVDMCWARHEQYHKRATKVAKAKSVPARPGVPARVVNPRFTLFAVILQTEERKCLLALDAWLQTQGRQMDIYIHDGGEIRKLENELEFPAELIKGGEEAILKATGYSHKLKIKPLEHNFKMPERKSSGTLYDDAYAAREFIRLMGDNIQRDGETVYYFDEKTGLWSDSDTQFRIAVNKHRTNLVFTDADHIYNYGGNETSVAAMKKWVAPQLEDTNFMTRYADSSVGKLLWRDGIYDFTTGEFSEGFNPLILFKCRINRPFPRSIDTALMDKVETILFKSAFDEGDGQEAGRYLMKAMTMAIFGDYRRKKFYFGLGDSNCGKGLLTQAMASAFGSYVAQFDANNFKYNSRNGQDEAKQKAWLTGLDGSRIAFANELRMDKVPIDGNLLKAVSSGGDEMKIRTNHKDERAFVCRTTVFLMANDLLPCQPEDSGTRERRRVMRYRLRFVDEPTAGDERKKDPSLIPWFQNNEEVKDAVFGVLARCYKAMPDSERCVNGHIPEPKCVIEDTKEWAGDGADNFKDIITEHYKITNNVADFVPSKDIIAYVKGAGIRMSDQLVGRNLTKLIKLPEGVESVGVRRGAKVRFGIRLRTEDDAEVEEPTENTIVLAADHHEKQAATNAAIIAQYGSEEAYLKSLADSVSKPKEINIARVLANVAAKRAAAGITL